MSVVIHIDCDGEGCRKAWNAATTNEERRLATSYFDTIETVEAIYEFADRTVHVDTGWIEMPDGWRVEHTAHSKRYELHAGELPRLELELAETTGISKRPLVAKNRQLGIDAAPPAVKPVLEALYALDDGLPEGHSMVVKTETVDGKPTFTATIVKDAA